jgi:hypothetical protein
MGASHSSEPDVPIPDTEIPEVESDIDSVYDEEYSAYEEYSKSFSLLFRNILLF